MTDQSIQNFEAGIDEGDYALEHQVEDKTYFLIALFLGAMTALEVVAAYTRDTLGRGYVWTLMVLMGIKLYVATTFFMHLKFDHATCKVVFGFAFTVAVVIFVLMLATFGYWAPGYPLR